MPIESAQAQEKNVVSARQKASHVRAECSAALIMAPDCEGTMCAVFDWKGLEPIPFRLKTSEGNERPANWHSKDSGAHPLPHQLSTRSGIDARGEHVRSRKER